MSPVRTAFAVVLLAAAGTLSSVAGRPSPTPADATPSVPLQLDGWSGTDAPPLDEATLRELAADRIVNRVYTGADGSRIGLYMATYGRQRTGSSVHSPRHCLPGTGWNVVSDEIRDATPAAAGSYRRLLAVRGSDRILVMYWYAIHGRMVASDALSRLYLLHDGVRFGRNDAVLIRLVVPADDRDPGRASQTGMGFLRALAPYLEPRGVPSLARVRS